MPRWDFECPKCKHIEMDVTGSNAEFEKIRPQHCGAPMELVWLSPNLATKAFEAFVTTHIDPDGKPLRVGSQSELSRICHQHGLNQVDDPGVEMTEGKLYKIPKKVTYFT